MDTLTTSALTGQRVDVAFVIDTTGSMGPYINNNWVRRITHNSPTTHQLLPTGDYFNTTHALDLRTVHNIIGLDVFSRNVAWSEFYRVLDNSDRINSNLLSSAANPRSHRSFRANSLNETSNRNIIDTFRGSNNATVFAIPHGRPTPATAIYCIANGVANASFLDIRYSRAGDNTVYHTSKGITLDERNDVIGARLHTFWHIELNHTSILNDSHALNNVVDLINNASGNTRSFSAAGNGIYNPDVTESFMEIPPMTETMESYVKLRIESSGEIDIRVYDRYGTLIAFNEPGYLNFLEGQDLIWDQFGDENETLTSIYLPREGYRVSFSHGTETDVPIDLTVNVLMLGADGFYTAFGSYFNSVTVEGGGIFTLDMTGGVNESNLENLIIMESTSPSTLVVSSEVFETWTIDFSSVNKPNDVVILDDVGSTATIGIVGNIDLSLLKWRSSDESVVTVEDGVITATGHGRARVTVSATDGSGKTYFMHTKVTLPATSVTFDNYDLFLGERVVIIPEFNSDRVTERMVHYSYDDTAGIIVIEDDVIVAVGVGTIRVTGTAAGGATSTFTVTVTDDTVIAVESVNITPGSANISVGTQMRFASEVSPLNATNRSVRWHIEDEAVARLVTSDNYGCVVEGVEVGSTRLIALTEDGGYVGIANIVVYLGAPPDDAIVMEFTFNALSYVVHGAESIFITVEAREDVPFMPVIFRVNEDGTRTDVSDMIAEVTYSNGIEYNTVSCGEWGMLSFYKNEVWVTVKLVDGSVLSSSFSYTIEAVVE